MPTPPRCDPAAVRLLVVDDHEVVRTGLASALGRTAGMRVVASAGSGAEAIRLARRERPDVAVVDLRLPDMSGAELCARLRAEVPGLAVVMLSSYLAEDAVRDALAAGASGYVTKAAGLAELRRALAESVRPGAGPAGVSQIVRRMRRAVDGPRDDGAPTPRQIRVLELVARGLTYAEVADRLVISESTVRFHVQRLKLRLGTRSRTELVARAVRAGLVADPDEEALP